MDHIEFSDYSPVTDGSYDDEYEWLEEDVAKKKVENKLGNVFKQSDTDAI